MAALVGVRQVQLRNTRIEMSFNEFFDIWLEIADAIDTFRYAMRLTGVMRDLIALFALHQKAPKKVQS